MGIMWNVYFRKEKRIIGMIVIIMKEIKLLMMRIKETKETVQSNQIIMIELNDNTKK